MANGISFCGIPEKIGSRHDNQHKEPPFSSPTHHEVFISFMFSPNSNIINTCYLTFNKTSAQDSDSSETL